ncbi:MAG: adenosylcobalamin-dependent ribonucleoside-diphosphate reductase [Nanoarchaeota archaeon]
MELPEYAKDRVKFSNPKVADTFVSKYSFKDTEGKPTENPEQVLYRVARRIADVDMQYNPSLDLEAKTKEYFDMMANFEFLPNTPTLMNAGQSDQLAACFVLPIEDSRKSIFTTLADAVEIQAFGGGTGFDFSDLRPKGSRISTTSGKSSGPISFMEVYDVAIGKTIAQGGKRKGANMGAMNYDHPDIVEFIYTKFYCELISAKLQEMRNSEEKYEQWAGRREAPMAGFNLSVKLSDEFMKLALSGGYYPLRNPHKKSEDALMTKEELEKLVMFGKSDETFKNDFGLEGDDVINIHEKEGSRYRKIGKIQDGKVCLDAKKMLLLISDMAWRCGCPGIIFIDRMNDANPTPGEEIDIPGAGKIKATNPCGEQPLLPYESCNLGSINLVKMLKRENGKVELDYTKLEQTVSKAYSFLDNVIDAISYPDSVKGKFDPVVKANRKIGMGIMGLGDALIELGYAYDSEEGIKFAKDIIGFIKSKALEESEKRALERGAFPNFGRSIYKEGKPRRNATLTTIAPTGTIGTIAEVSEGMEPLYGLFYLRKTGEGKVIPIERNAFKVLKSVLKERGIELSNADLETIISSGGVQKTSLPDDIKQRFKIAYDLDYKAHIRMQAVIQSSGVDNAVSKTNNLPNSASVEDIINAYTFAWTEGCKGITVYRDGSKSYQVLNFGDKKKEAVRPAVRERPEWLPAWVRRMETPNGKASITITDDEFGAREVFVSVGRSGSDIAGLCEALGRSISIGLKYNAPPQEYANSLKGIGGRESVGFGPNRVLSVPDGIAKAMEEYCNILNKHNVDTEKSAVPEASGDLCPQCGGKLVKMGGCAKCLDPACAFSKC